MKPLILIVDDERSFRDLYSLTLQEEGFDTLCAESAETALRLLEENSVSLVVSDVRMPGKSGIELLQTARKQYEGLPFLLVTAYADVRDAVLALKLGAVDYLSKPVDLDEFVVAVKDNLGIRSPMAATEIPEHLIAGVVAESASMADLLRNAYRVAVTDATVLLTGESGVGKEVVANFIHRAGKRNLKKLVAVNCAAIPGQLLASELFGHEKGSFTGADKSRPGRFREADGGTLFLDEIGDMALELQPALLRVLENSTIIPVGSDREVKVDYRLIAATNSILEEAVESGKFRMDLYYRLNVIALEIPPLRTRKEDILPLARHFLVSAGGKGKRISRAATEILLNYKWPGNVRELANAMERAHILSGTDVIMPEHLPPALNSSDKNEESSSFDTGSSDNSGVKTLREVAETAIRNALDETEGNKTKAAELLGITRRGLIKKLKRLDES
jgi:DNA-binding NtrC family response regulator